MAKKAKVKSGYRFNMFDVVLIVVMVLCLASIGYLVYKNGFVRTEEKGETEYVDVICIIKDEKIDKDLRGKVNIGDSVYDRISEKFFGEVTNTEYSDSEYYYFDAVTGEAVKGVYSEYIDMRLRVICKAEKDPDGSYKVGDTVLSAGGKIEYRVPYYEGNGVCVSVSEVTK